jgi:hypothetical protein
VWQNPIVAKPVTIAKHDKRKHRVLSDCSVALETKGRNAATSALERELKEAKVAKDLDCPPDFFTEPLDD